MVEGPFSNVRVSIIDGVGCGEALNRRDQYPRDRFVNSLLHAAKKQPLDAQALLLLGLLNIPQLEKLNVVKQLHSPVVRGAYGRMVPTFSGNGSPEGHQALMGHIVTDPYMLYDEPPGFPPELVTLVQRTIAETIKHDVQIVRNPGTDDISGPDFINHPGIGDAHLASGKTDGPWIFPMYASSDSLIQIPTHRDIVPQTQVEQIGHAVREAVDREGLRIARIIMRPFTGGPNAGDFVRISEGRKDFGMDPDDLTLIDFLTQAGVPVYALGKAADMLNCHGFDPTHIQRPDTDEEKMRLIVADFERHDDTPRFSFDNLIWTDEKYGHPRKPEKYIQHINLIARYIDRGMQAMTDKDLWIITSDHGNDPTQKKHRNHTNEMVPLLIYSPRIKKAVNLGTRSTYVDLARTVAENFGIADKIKGGKSFLRELL